MPVMTTTRPAAGKAESRNTRSGGARGRVRVPNKRSINFAEVGVQRINWLAAIPAIVLIVAAAVLFSKFLVYDRLAEVSAAEGETLAVQRELNETYSRIDSYGELNELYAHYTYSGMTEEELSRVDRVAVMELLERVVFPRTSVTQWTLSGNMVTLNINGSTLQEINDTVQTLLKEDIVYYCRVNTAAADSTSVQTVEAAENGDNVTANIIIYLSTPEEAAS